MRDLAEVIAAHLAKLVRYESMPAPRGAYVEGSMVYHRDALRHLDHMQRVRESIEAGERA